MYPLKIIKPYRLLFFLVFFIPNMRRSMGESKDGERTTTIFIKVTSK